jgi:small subunit ribosomal protein S5
MKKAENAGQKPAAPEQAEPAKAEPAAVPVEFVEEVKLEVEKDVITEIPEEEAAVVTRGGIDITAWKPKTAAGQGVKAGTVTDIDQLLDKGVRILETEIVEVLLPGLQSDLLMVGQAKGKFGGGQRRIFKQTQKKTPEGNKPSFSCMAVVGNTNGYVGVGTGKSKDTVPAREKAVRKAKLNVFKIARGCGSWECGCKTPHSIPFEVEGKCGSVRVVLKPAPKGKGLVIEPECAKILRLAGIKDVWSKTSGQTRITTNFAHAVVDALKKLTAKKIRPQHAERVAFIAGKITGEVTS